jgi:hypothetical protein
VALRPVSERSSHTTKWLTANHSATAAWHAGRYREAMRQLSVARSLMALNDRLNNLLIDCYQVLIRLKAA